MECFDTFLRELAYFYVPGPIAGEPSLVLSSSALSSSTKVNRTKEEEEGDKAERWQIQHVLFPAMRRYMLAPKSLLDVDVVQVADLPDLYKVFERC
jgi:DNA mismatch repair protein MLH1